MIDPADAHQLDTLLHRHRIELKHRFGQNFLTDQRIRDAIAEAAGIEPGDEVLEVGAGVGTLTRAVAPRARRLVAVELDRDMMPALRDVMLAHDNVELVQGDILKLDLAALFPAGGHVVVGNIPYQLTGALIRKLLDAPPRPRRLSLVVQKEVAERWTGAGGASLATVAVSVFAVPQVMFTIPAASFTPVPRVDSALVILDVRARPAVEVDDVGRFLRFAEAVFQFRRKQLGGAIGRVTGLGSTEAGRTLRQIGVDPERRPQTLSLAEWESVYLALNRAPDR